MVNTVHLDDAQRVALDKVFQVLHELLRESGRDLLVVTCSAAPQGLRTDEPESLVLQVFRGKAAEEAILQVGSVSSSVN